MKEKTLKKSAHFISILLNIGCFIFGILSALLFIGITVIVGVQLFSPEMMRDAWETAVKAGQTLSVGQCVFFFLCCFGEFVCSFLALYNARRIFSCIGKGNSPFTDKIAVQIRKIALYVVLFAVFSVLSVFKLLSLPSFIMCVLFALILFCISLIFDYGCQLQKEVDETL